MRKSAPIIELVDDGTGTGTFVPSGKVEVEPEEEDQKEPKAERKRRPGPEKKQSKQQNAVVRNSPASNAMDGMEAGFFFMEQMSKVVSRLMKI
jgi:hypothetical protein